MTTRDCNSVCGSFSSFSSFFVLVFRKKLIALVAQKFISDVAMDAMQFSRMRQASSTAGSSEAARKAASLKVIKWVQVNQTFNSSFIF